MAFNKLAATLTAVALVAAPTMATAATSAQAPVSSSARSGAAVQNESELEGAGIGLYIIGAIVVGLAIWGIIELTKDDKNNAPTSP